MPKVYRSSNLKLGKKILGVDKRLEKIKLFVGKKFSSTT